MLLAAGVDLLGFPLRLPVHTPDLSEDETARLIRACVPPTHACLITYETDPAAVADLARLLGARWVQLHADVAPGVVAELRNAAPELGLIAALVVHGEDHDALVARGLALAPFVDACITDTFDPESGARGATGKTHDWSVSAALAHALPVPLLLAGGLTPDNVAAAVRAVQPFGVDAHTGLENERGDKDEAKVRAFVRRAKEALGRVSGSQRA